MLFCFRRKAFRKQKINFVNGVSEATSQVTGATTERSQESLEKEKLSRWIWYNGSRSCVWLTKRIHHTWKVVKGMSLFNSDLIYDSDLQLYSKVCNRPRHLHRSGTLLEMFLVSLLYDRICLRIDVFKINYWLNILFII